MSIILESVKNAVIYGKDKEIVQLVEDALNNNIPPNTIIDEGLITGMSIIGTRFKNREVFVPDILIAARAMHLGMSMLKPMLNQKLDEKGLIVMGTVKGDLHDIGKNLVIMMLEGAGFKVVDMGVDVSTDKFLEAAELHKPFFIGLSALLTTTMPEMESTLKKLKANSSEVKIMVGGAPVTEEYALSIGADLYAPDAVSAAEKVLDIIA